VNGIGVALNLWAGVIGGSGSRWRATVADKLMVQRISGAFADKGGLALSLSGVVILFQFMCYSWRLESG